MSDLSVGLMSITGPQRESNQDTVGAPPLYHLDRPVWEQYGHLLAVADGVGGQGGGDIASQTAMAALFREFYSHPQLDLAARLQTAAQQANLAVITAARANPAYNQMRTTLVAAAYHRGQLVIINIGDSRAYILRRGRLTQITQDHSLAQAQLKAGLLTPGEAAQAETKNVLYRSVGHAEDLTIDLFTPAVRPGDSLLLCSDGLSNIVTGAEITAYLQKYPPQTAAEKLTALAEQRQSPDNVSVVVARFGRQPHQSGLPPAPVVALAVGMLVVVMGLLLVILNGPGRAATSPTATHTATPTATPTPTPTLTPTHTSTPTLTPTHTPTPTSTPTHTPTLTLTPTHTSIPTSTPTHTPIPTETPLPTAAPAPTPTATPVPPTDTPPPTPPPADTLTPTITLSATAAITPSGALTITVTATP